MAPGESIDDGFVDAEEKKFEDLIQDAQHRTQEEMVQMVNLTPPIDISLARTFLPPES